MPDDALGRLGGDRGDPGPRRRGPFLRSAPGGGPGLNAAAWAAAAALAAVGTILGVRKPDHAALALLVLAPLLPGATRTLGGDLPLLFFYAIPALAGSLAIRWRRGERSPLPRGILRWSLAFLGVAAVSALSSIVRGETLWRLLHGRVVPHYVNDLWMTSAGRSRDAILTFLGFVLLLAALDAFARLAADPVRRARLLAAAAAGGALALAAAALQPLVPAAADAERWAVYARYSGTFTDPNALGIGAALLALLAVALFFEPAAPSRWARGGALVVAVLAFPVLQLSGSRTGLAILAIALAAALAGLVRARAVPIRRVLVGVAAVLLLAVAVWPLLPKSGDVAAGGLAARLAAAVRTGSFAASANKRLVFWQGARDVILEEPLSGCGLGGFPYEFPVRFALRHRSVGFTDNATNALLDVAAECGLPALALAIAAAAPILALAFGAAFSRERIAAASRLGGAALVGFAAASMTGSHLRFPEIACYAAALAALVVVPGNLEAKSDPDLVPPRYAGAVLVVAGVVASLLVVWPTRRPEEAFRIEPWQGLYKPEPIEPGGFFRWMGPAALRRIRPGETSLALKLRNGRPDDLPVTLTVDVDGAPRRGLLVTKGSDATLELDGLSAGQIVRFSAQPSFVPGQRPGGRDGRALALIVLAPPGSAGP